jgi:hypothetical protein
MKMRIAIIAAGVLGLAVAAANAETAAKKQTAQPQGGVVRTFAQGDFQFSTKKLAKKQTAPAAR